MLSIAYVSAATDDVAEQDVAAILVQARANNERDGLTGALLFHGGRFIQIFEGEDDIVRRRYAEIASDPRHRSVQKMREKQIGARQFPQWTMGFRAPSAESVKELNGFEDFFARSGNRSEERRVGKECR